MQGRMGWCLRAGRGAGCAGKYCSPLVLALGPASGDGDQGWDVVAALRRVLGLSRAGRGVGWDVVAALRRARAR